MRIRNNRQSGFGAGGIVIIILVIGVVAGTGALVAARHNRRTTSAAVDTSPRGTPVKTPPATAPTPPSQSIMHYTSKEESATFQYPDTWTSGQPDTGSVTPGSTDAVTLKSPSGALTITWNPSLAGVGNGYGDSYPLNAVIDKTPIPGASDLFVVSGTTTLDSKTYYPWIAVQDNSGITKSGVAGDILFFAARKARNSSTGTAAYALFSTSGVRANIGTPALTENQANTWFSSAEAQEAKQILLSLTYSK